MFKNSTEAFEYYTKMILNHGQDFADTKALFNVGFLITNPTENIITSDYRKFNIKYAEAEWQWYLSGDRNIAKLGELYGKVPEIWKRMADCNGDVNSNYGWQWQRQNQIGYIINMLEKNPYTRQAAISIYDCKEWSKYKNDTPCTYAVQFTVVDNKLNMCVLMRSNDLWYGFCNDQYQFSSLQKLVAEGAGCEVGTYYHFAHNLHLYYKTIKNQKL